MGKDITNVDGVNLAAMIYNSEKLKNGSNELIYALIALDAADIQIPGNAKWNRASIIRALGEFQNPTTGGIGLTDAKGGSSDITAMALQALAVYRNHNTAAKNISDKALTYLANAMGDDFGYGTCESTAQVLLALTSMGIDPLSDDFGTVNMNSKSSEMSTVQALQALDSYRRFVNKETTYWDLKNKGEHAKHSWDAGTVTKKSTCKTKGTKSYTCTWCGEKKTESTALAAHKWSSWKTTKSATVFAPKQITRTCSVCAKKEAKNSGSKLKPTIKLNAYGIRLNPGKSTSKVKVSGLAKGDSVKSWKSSNTAIVKVDKKGVITAQKKTGTAYITVTLASKKTAKLKVVVQKGTVRTAAITGLQSRITISKGKTTTLKPIRRPITSAEKLTYSSSNKAVATVSSKGVVRGVKKGTAVITVRSGKVSYKCRVTVK